MATTTPPTGDGVISRPSPRSVADTLARCEDILGDKGLTLFAHIDHSAEARRVGLTMQETHVLIFGNPTAGTPLMVAAPLIALDLPLKVLIWQDAAGQVWVSYTDPAYLARRYGLPASLVPNIAGVAGVVSAVVAEA